MNVKTFTFEHFPSWAVDEIRNYTAGNGIQDKQLVKFIEDNLPDGFNYADIDDDSYNPFDRYPFFGGSCGTYTITFYKYY